MSTKTVHYLKDYQAPEFHILTTHLTFDIQADATTVTNDMQIKRVSAGSQSSLVLDGQAQKLIEVRCNDEIMTDYVLTEHTLTLTDLPDQCHLTIVSQNYPAQNTSLAGLYQSGDLLCTQCESHGFQKITYYLDRPDVLSSFTTTIIADKTYFPVLLSNGDKVSQKQLADNRHQVTWHDPHLKPCYLFALVAGKLFLNRDHFITQSGRKVALEIYARQGDIDKTDHAMQCLKDAMKWDENTFGREYDLSVYMIVAVSDFNMGAMENKGLNVFNTKYVLANPKTATDKDFELIHTVIGHEYFHNWTGNRVTCRDWFQLSLKEGLTVFRDELFTKSLYSPTVKRIEDVNIIRSAQFAEDASPMAHPIRPASYIEMNNFYTVTVYNKGAEVIGMQHTLVGEDGFRKGMDLYFERHDGQAVTCDDFVAAIADANDIDLTQFKRWYHQAGTPIVTVKDQYDSAKQTYTLTITQHTEPTADGSAKEPFYFPFALGLLDAQGNTVLEDIAIIDQAEQTLTFKGMTSHPTPSLLRNFSAPVKLQYDYTEAQLLFLMAHDNNAFNRWDAGQKLAERIIQHAMHSDHPTLPKGYLAALEKALMDPALDKALIAQALTLPMEQALGQNMQPIEVDACHHAREWLLNQIAHGLSERFFEIYHNTQLAGSYQLKTDHIAKRRLKNVCLHYLTRTQDAKAIALAETQFQQANNMTDQLAALSALTQSDANTVTQNALKAFYTQWKEEELVINKWLTLQAQTQHDNTLDNVKGLLSHPAYNDHNPNKIYALLVGFCQNTAQLHHKSGRGYAFIAEQVRHIDSINPQVAARIARLIMNWRQYDEARQALMKAALQSIVDKDTLSPDVYEIVSKSLQ